MGDESNYSTKILIIHQFNRFHIPA